MTHLEPRYGAFMPPASRLATRIASPIAATIILLLPAAWNRFPLLEYDTGGYLARWFEGTLGLAGNQPSRSTTYGLLLAAGSPLDFWLIAILQAALTVWIIDLMLRIFRIDRYPLGLPAIVAALSATTALPWLASMLLTDIFAGLGVIAFYALTWHGDRIGRFERVALVVFLAYAVSTHSATYAVLLLIGVAALLLSWRSAALVPRQGVIQGAAALALGAVMLLTANYIVAKRIAWTPGGYGLSFGHMLQTGIVKRYLNDHCPDPRLRLCAYRNVLPKDADQFFWGDSVFKRLGGFVGLDDEMRTIVLGSLRDYPLMQIKSAVVATERQLVEVRSGYGIINRIWNTYWTIQRYAPEDLPAMHAARQQRDGIDFAVFNAIDVPVAWASMALLPLIIIFGLRSRAYADLGRLAATVALAIVANAAVCGILSNPHDRYGARMVWIAAFTVALAGCRSVQLARKRLITARSAASAARS